MTELPTNARWSESDLASVRGEVLRQWPTGDEVELEEALAYNRAVPPAKNVALVRSEAKSTGRKLLQPLAGVPLVEDHIQLLQHLQRSGTASILPTQVDSQTRTLNFAGAKRAIELTRESGRDELNGYPVVNHGLAGARRVTKAVEVPVELRIGTVDPRLAAEIAFAGGISSITAGPVYYTVHYSSNASFADSIHNWQYVFRLAGWYTERGVPIGLQIHGAGNSTPFPMSLLGACCALECLIAAEQGARHFSVDVRLMGNLVQDIAAAHVVPDLCARYLAELGYDDCVVTVDRKTWSGRYPEDKARAFGLVSYNAVSGMLAGVNEFICNSVEEAIGIPTKEANAETLRATRQIIGMLDCQMAYPRTAELEEEEALMTLAGRALVDATLELGDGDPATGVARAFELGMLDVPFAASSRCRGEVMVARDGEGAVRYLDPGGLPLPKRVVDYERERLDRRVVSSGAPIGYKEIVADIFSISEGYLVSNDSGKKDDT